MSESSVPTTMPRIGDPAPEFKAVTTQGPIHFPNEHAGKWVILFSHPADFTPVCTTEFMTFATRQEEFRKYNCELVGLSVDGLFSHIAWLRTIKEKMEFRDMKDVEVTFPLIEDITMDVANKYGMIHPGDNQTKALRAVFVIDPKGVIQAIIYYPASMGRNFDEILRLVKGLQVAQNFEVALPADWKPGEPVIVPPPGSCGAAKDRMVDPDVHAVDWFFSTKDISEAQIEERIAKV